MKLKTACEGKGKSNMRGASKGTAAGSKSKATKGKSLYGNTKPKA